MVFALSTICEAFVCTPPTVPPTVGPTTKAAAPASMYSLRAPSSAGEIGSPACKRSNACCVSSVGTSATPIALPLAIPLRTVSATVAAAVRPYIPNKANRTESAAD